MGRARADLRRPRLCRLRDWLRVARPLHANLSEIPCDGTEYHFCQHGVRAQTFVRDEGAIEWIGELFAEIDFGFNPAAVRKRLIEVKGPA